MVKSTVSLAEKGWKITVMRENHYHFSIETVVLSVFNYFWFTVSLTIAERFDPSNHLHFISLSLHLFLTTISLNKYSAALLYSRSNALLVNSSTLALSHSRLSAFYRITRSLLASFQIYLRTEFVLSAWQSAFRDRLYNQYRTLGCWKRQ